MGWKKGQSGNPGGRPKGSPPGRAQVLRMFDRIVGEAGHQEALETEIRRLIADHGMLWFYQNYIFPLLPREAAAKILGVGADGEPATMTLKFEVAEPEPEQVFTPPSETPSQSNGKKKRMARRKA